MDAFEYNKYNEAAYFKARLSNYTIVSYGFITGIETEKVDVTLAVSDQGFAQRVSCTFMNLGDDQFAVLRKPTMNMRVLVLSPNKAAEGMYEPYEQMNLEHGRSFILAQDPAVYSSQSAICIPVMKSTSQPLSSIIVESTALSAEIKHELLIALKSALEIDFYQNTNAEFHEDTDHYRGYYGNLEQTFGIIEGLDGKEKDGDYVYTETYGKYASVSRSYESGLTAVVGKAYNTPFLADKGELLDSSAPVTISLGNKAPLFFATGSPVDIIAAADSPIAIGTESPVTLIFGEDVMTITLDAENGLDIALTGNTKVNIVAETGKFNFKNDNGSLKDVLDKIADLLNSFTTIGGNVVPGVPYTAGASPAVIALVVELKAFTAGLLE